MVASDVVALIDTLSHAGIICWLDGGWAVDAVVGHQTRPHEDLDLVIAAPDVPAAIETLRAKGFAVDDDDDDDDDRPCSFTMVTADRRKVDIHPVTWDQKGGGVQAQPNNTSFTYPAHGFSGVGRVAGRSLRCLTADVQVLCHGGYELDADDLQDLEALKCVLANQGTTV